MSHFEVIVQNYRQVTAALMEGLPKHTEVSPAEVNALTSELSRSLRMVNIMFPIEPITEEKDEHHKV